MLEISRTYSAQDFTYVWQASDPDASIYKTYPPEASIGAILAEFKKLGYYPRHHAGQWSASTPRNLPRALPLEWEILASTPEPVEVDF